MSFDSTNALLLDLNDYLNNAANADKQTPSSTQWMENYGGHPTAFDLFAPDPDLFDSELEATDLSALDIPFNAHEPLQPLQPAAYYGTYRGPASAFNGTVSSLSESQSGYDGYDTASFYSGHESGYNHPHLGANAGSLYGVNTGGSAVGAVPQHFHNVTLTSANSHYGTAPSDIDLDFAELNFSAPGGMHAQLGALAAPAVGNPAAPTPAIDTSALNSVHLFMNQTIPSYTPQSQASLSQSQSPVDVSQQPEMYFPRRGDPHVPVASSSAQRGAKREATSSPAIPTPDFAGIEQQLGRPSNKRIAASSGSVSGVADMDEGTGPASSKRYKCPSCDRAFARAYNLKTHLATHDPHRVKSFVCRHTGCGRSFSRKHDLGRHYTSIHGGSGSAYGGGGGSTYNGGGSVNGNMSGEERAAVRGHRAGSGSAYNGNSGREGDGSSSTEGEQSPSAPVIPSSAKGNSNSKHKLHQERVWCDGCGRGWIKGTPEACDCDDAGASANSTSRASSGSQYRGE